MFNKLAGIAIATVFTLIYSGNVDWFQNFNDSVSESLGSDVIGHHRGSGGAIYLFLPVIGSVFFLLFPSLSARFFSPKDMYEQPILKRDFWFIPGYFLALVGWGLLYVFE